MSVRLVIEVPTVAELRPYIEAMQSVGQGKAEPTCAACSDTGLTVDHDGVTHACPACKVKAPCVKCKGTRRVRTLNGDSEWCLYCAC